MIKEIFKKITSFILGLIRTILFLSLALIILITIGISSYLALSTARAERDPQQQTFQQGSIENPPQGYYPGTSDLPLGSWQGKIFKDDKGNNIFKEQGKNVAKYRFITHINQGLRDQDTEVITIDYNLPQNPFWLRYFIVDEIVAIDNDKYLGKVHLKVIPQLTFTLGYFTLEKTSTN